MAHFKIILVGLIIEIILFLCYLAPCIVATRPNTRILAVSVRTSLIVATIIVVGTLSMVVSMGVGMAMVVIVRRAKDRNHDRQED